MCDEHAQHQRTVDGLLACQCRGPPARGRHSCLLRHARAEVRARTQGAHRERQVQEGACPAPGGHTEGPRAPLEPPPHRGGRNRAPHLRRRRPRLARTGVPQVDRRFLPRPQLALHALLLVQTQGPPHGEGHLPPRGGRLVGGQGHRDHGQVHAEHTIPRRRTSLCRGDPRGAERHPCQVARGVPSVLAEQEQGGALRARVVPRHQQQDRGCALQAWPPAAVRRPGLGSVPRLGRQGALHLVVQQRLQALRGAALLGQVPHVRLGHLPRGPLAEVAPLLLAARAAAQWPPPLPHGVVLGVGPGPRGGGPPQVQGGNARRLQRPRRRRRAEGHDRAALLQCAFEACGGGCRSAGRQGLGRRRPAGLLCCEFGVHRIPPVPVPPEVPDHLRGVSVTVSLGRILPLYFRRL
mmetsp:Transcript_74566/g.196534  ORF Transcript_74566/g.196534 Transcript_74566/m.196534 type:complete len:408 (-) Transcript_74566:202-1425(-)